MQTTASTSSHMYKLTTQCDANVENIKYIFSYLFEQKYKNEKKTISEHAILYTKIKQQLIDSYILVKSGSYDKTLYNYKELLGDITSDKISFGKYIVISSAIILLKNQIGQKYSPMEFIFLIKQCNAHFGTACSHGINQKDIEIVQNQSGCTFNAALKALISNDGDIVNAIMELTM